MLTATPQYFKNLDGLRFLCFLSVFSVHSLHSNNVKLKSNFFFNTIVDGLLANGEIGVNFFFVLSGFLITYLLIVEKQTTGSVNIPNFWFKRIIRIWPLYFACLFFGFLVFPYLKVLLGQVPTETADFKLYLFFMGNFNTIWNGQPDATELAVLWSIAVEEQFYLIWPVILYFVPVKKYWIVFISFILGSLLFRTFNDDPVIYYFHTLSCISDMAVGGFGAWLINQIPFKNIIVSLSKFKIIVIYVLFAVVFVFCRQI
jgi:peptidoglycan/LPS O-acetylase OafA/YrhL